MKKWLFLLATCFSKIIFGSPIQDRQIDPVALSELTSALGIPQDADIIAETQKRWLRGSNTLRWEMTELSLDQRAFVLKWAREQGLYDPWKPSHKTYDKALILGASTRLMQARLDYLKKLWDEGVRFSEIVWLTGDRPLDKRIDDLLDLCSNESEAVHIIWERADLPQEIKNLPVSFVAVPMKKQGELLKNPNTEDTIIAWLNTAPESYCKALFVSDQPFCGYQFAVVKATLPKTILFDVVGAGVDPASHPLAAAITLDSIARWLYQENLCR